MAIGAIWEGLRPLVAEKYHFVSLSLRYHYPNAWADDGRNYSMTQHVENVVAFIRALKVGKVHLVGNSYGGRLVAYVALQYPELLRSVVLGEPRVSSHRFQPKERLRLPPFKKIQPRTAAVSKQQPVGTAVGFPADLNQP